MLRRPRRCRCSRTGWRHTCSAAATKLFDFSDISFPNHYLPLQNSGPCNSFYCLGHSKNVCDDDDDDDDTLGLRRNRRRWLGTLYLRLTSTDLDIFGTNVAGRACTVICFRISPKCLCTTWGNMNVVLNDRLLPLSTSVILFLLFPLGINLIT